MGKKRFVSVVLLAALTADGKPFSLEIEADILD